MNYGNKIMCEMGCHEQILNNEHLLNCPTINGNNVKVNLQEILNGSNKEKNLCSTKTTRKHQKKN